MIPALAGFLAGSIHVLSGPDHLAAIAPLAAEEHRRAWLTGLRWGLGHTLGVGLVGLLSLLLRETLPLELLSSWGERLVGVMLVGIGLWGLRKGLSQRVHSHEHIHDGLRHAHFHLHQHPTSHTESRAHRHTHAAWAVGILHGLAGSSHLLGVLPALALPSYPTALQYLVAFGLGTVVAMVGFASTVGLLTSRLAAENVRVCHGFLSFFSFAAIGVGSFWLLA